MPTYEYRCNACKHEFEEFQSMTARPLTKCPACGKKSLERLIGTGAAIVFKGSGFWQTDYRSEAYKKAAEADKPPEKSESKGETKSGNPGEEKTAERAAEKPAEKSSEKAGETRVERTPAKASERPAVSVPEKRKSPASRGGSAKPAKKKS